jgi:hypothetical protein
MKKTIFISALVLVGLASTLVYSQSSPETMSRIRDRTSATTMANVSQLGATMPAANFGLDTASGCYYYRAGTWYAWTGAAAGADNVSNATPAPYVYNLSMVYDSGTGTWDRMTQPTGNTPAAVSDAMGAFPLGVWSVGINTFFDGTNYRRWRGEDWDTALAIITNPNVNALGVYWDGARATRLIGEDWDTTIANINAPESIALSAFYELGATTGYRWQGELWDTDMAGTTNPNVNAFGVYRNESTSKNARVQGEAWDADMAVVNAPTAIALNAFRDATSSKNMWWTGALWSADMAVTAAPNVNALTTWRDTTNSRNSQWTGEAYDNSMTATPVNPNVNAMTAFYNGTNTQYWNGSVLSSETTVNTGYAPHAKNYTYCYDATSASWRWVNVIDAQADGQASTLNGQVTSAFGYGFNGSTWDMLRVGASNELQTTDVATRAGEDVANDWRKVKIESRYTYSPSYTDTDMTAAAETTILGPLEVLGDVNWCVYIKNIDDAGGQAFTDVDVYISPNNSDWIDMSWSDCDSLSFGSLCNYCVSGNAYRYVRVTATSGSDNYARAWYTSNK